MIEDMLIALAIYATVGAVMGLVFVFMDQGAFGRPKAVDIRAAMLLGAMIGLPAGIVGLIAHLAIQFIEWRRPRPIAALRRAWHRAFPPRAIRLPGKFPWTQPSPLPFGTILIPGNPPIVSDGKGGILVGGWPDELLGGARHTRASGQRTR